MVKVWKCNGETNLQTERGLLSAKRLSAGTCGLVAMTSASHAEGHQFDPGQVYSPQQTAPHILMYVSFLVLSSMRGPDVDTFKFQFAFQRRPLALQHQSNHTSCIHPSLVHRTCVTHSAPRSEVVFAV